MEALQIRDELESRRELKRERPFSLLTSIGNTPLIQIRQMAKHLRGVRVYAKAEWLWVGPSSGAAFWASLKLAESMNRGVIVTIFPDGGARYPEYCIDCEKQKKRLSVEYPKLTPSPP